MFDENGQPFQIKSRSWRKGERVTGLRYDDGGQLMHTKVYIVYGSPGSGKTTYVRKHMRPGDLMVDLDYLSQAISLADKTGAYQNLMPTALQLRECLYQLIERRQVDCESVWIVAGLPKKSEREQLAQRLNAELVYIDTDKDECIKRAMADDERKDKDVQLRIIRNWFRVFFSE